MSAPISSARVVVRKYGDAGVLRIERHTTPPPGPGRIRVRVLAASVGSTDILARRGGYLLQPVPPVVPGYDLIGEIEAIHPSAEASLAAAGLGIGSRIACCMPRMGAYRQHLTLPAWQAVPVPDALDTVIAAALPLDYLTALTVLKRHARAEPGGAYLIHGASGAVGGAIVQLARDADRRANAGGGAAIESRLYGTASARNRSAVEAQGVRFLDYRTDISGELRSREPNGLDGVFDHRGGSNVTDGLRLLRSGGVFVGYAFTGRPGRERLDTAIGPVGLLAKGVPFSRRGVRTAVCSLPFTIATDHGGYRQALDRLLRAAEAGTIAPPIGRTFGFEHVQEAHRAVEAGQQGKTVLLMES